MISFKRFFGTIKAPFYSAIYLQYKPLLPIGGHLLKSGLTKTDILKQYLESPNKLMKHVESGDGLASLTPDLAFATKHSQYGGWDSNISDSSFNYEPPSVVAKINPSKIDVLNVRDLISNAKHYKLRMKKENESVTVIVLPTVVEGWYINNKFVANPFYLPFSDENNPQLNELEKAFIAIMKKKADHQFTGKNPQAVALLDRYHSILCDIAGGHEAFKQKLETLKTDIKAAGYEMDPESAMIFNRALEYASQTKKPSLSK